MAHRADSLDAVVKGLDNYKQVAAVSVNFGFDKSVLTKDDQAQLDSFAGQLGSAKSYILEVTGGTDSVGSAQYNYDLSQRRADSVVQYLAAKYNIAPHRFYLIGIGKDQYVADNKTAEGRKENRRVSGAAALEYDRRQHAGAAGCSANRTGGQHGNASAGSQLGLRVTRTRANLMNARYNQANKGRSFVVCPFCFC